MPADLHKMPVEEIRRLLLADGAPVSGQTLAKLQKDPRRAIRELYRTLQAQRRVQQRERLRVRSMLYLEDVLWRSGIERIAGVDEVGIGPLAGPVVAAAVIFPPGIFIESIDDSKKLDPRRRETLRERILEKGTAYAVSVLEVEEVDLLNVYQAGLEAMRRAVTALSPQPQHVLVDAREIPGVHVPQNRFDKGDGINFSIAAASILAKTHRDALMDQYHKQFPQYGFDRHKGYSTGTHQRALRDYGPCPIHRRSFQFVQEACGKFSPIFYQLRAELSGARSCQTLAEIEERLKPLQQELTEYEWRKLRLCSQRAWGRMSPAAARGVGNRSADHP